MPASIKGVTVLMPAYNAEKFIAFSLKSILSQTYKDFELIIVNDGSTDGTEEKILSFSDPRIKYIKTENKGTAAALNLGISKAKYEWIARVDSDDLITPERLEIQAEFINNNPGIDVISSWSVYFNNKGKILFFLLPPVEHSWIVDTLNLHNPLNQSGIIYRKKIIKKEKYNEGFRLNEDFELFYRIKDRVKFHNIPEYLVYTRMHKNSKSFSKRNSDIFNMLHTPAFKNLMDAKSKGEHFIWVRNIAWINFFYGNRKDSRSYFKKSVSLKNTIALIATFLPEKLFYKLIDYRIKYRFFALFKDKKRYYSVLKGLLN